MQILYKGVLSSKLGTRIELAWIFFAPHFILSLLGLLCSVISCWPGEAVTWELCCFLTSYTLQEALHSCHTLYCCFFTFLNEHGWVERRILKWSCMVVKHPVLLEVVVKVLWRNVSYSKLIRQAYEILSCWWDRIGFKADFDQVEKNYGWVIWQKIKLSGFQTRFWNK